MSEPHRDSGPRLPLPFVEPIVQPESDHFWSELQAHRLVVRHCNPCKSAYFYPRNRCPRCFSADTRWIPCSGRGRLHSFAIVHRAPAPIFQASVPYVIALVDLDEGPRLATNLIGAGTDPDSIQIGTLVEAVFDEPGERQVLVRFRQVPE